MARNKFGRFEKGTCGNPRGRPRKARFIISDEQSRQDFFAAAQTPVSIIENGRRKVVPARIAISKQLAIKAASGDMKAIMEFYKWDQRFTLDHVKQQLSNVEAIFNAEARIRKFPEDVTDEFKRALRLLHASMDPHYRLH